MCSPHNGSVGRADTLDIPILLAKMKYYRINKYSEADGIIFNQQETIYWARRKTVWDGRPSIVQCSARKQDDLLALIFVYQQDTVDP